jgi:hypothetical protein
VKPTVVRFEHRALVAAPTAVALPLFDVVVGLEDAVVAVVVLAAVILVLWIVGSAFLRRASGESRTGEDRVGGEKGRG